MKLWRIAHANHADLSGTGGLIKPGRWHSVGKPIIYAAEHSALAMFEVRVHLDLQAAQLSRFVMIKINVRENLPIIAIDDEPEDEAKTRAQGDAWLRSKASCIARVRSALAPDAHNYLLNPLHGDMGGVTVEAVAPLVLDARLFQ